MPADYEIIRSFRKTTTIKIVKGEVKVYAPIFVSDYQIKDFVAKHQDWIDKKLNDKKINLCFDLEKDDFIYILGCKYYLDIEINTKNSINIDGDNIYLKGRSIASIEKNFKEFLVKIIDEQVQRIKRELNVEFETQYRSLHSFWGNCNKKTKEIHFNIYLACVEKEAMISVIYHEIAHLKHANHQKEFYDYLLKIYPTYRKDNKLLKKYAIIK